MAWVLERETGKGVMELARFRSPVDALGRLGAMSRGGMERFPLRVVSDSGLGLLALGPFLDDREREKRLASPRQAGVKVNHP